MIPHDLIGSRPMDLDTAQRRLARARRAKRFEAIALEVLAVCVAVPILAGIGWGAYALWGWL